MSKININEWKEYIVGDLFNIHPTNHYNGDYGKALSNSFLFDENGINPVVVNSSYNNGIGGYTNKPCNEKGGIITFSDTTTADAIFYQEKDFVGYSHVQGLYPKIYEKEWSLYSMKFFEVSFHSRANTLGYNYVNKFTREFAEVMIVKLPSTSSGEPDFLYMEEYMKNIENIVLDSLPKIELAKEIKKKKVDTPDWKEFHLYDDDLFIIDSGTKLDRVKMETSIGEIAFVGRSNINNGITTKVKKIKKIKPYKKGYLTLALGGAYLGSCFVQPSDFYTSQNVAVLIPKHEMSFNIKQFIASAIFIESQNNYKAFIKELNTHINYDFVIKLPATPKGKPDWDYMEKYMSNIKSKVKNTLNNIV